MKIKPVVLYSRKTDPEWNNTHASRLNIVSAIRENQTGYMVTVK